MATTNDYFIATNDRQILIGTCLKWSTVGTNVLSLSDSITGGGSSTRSGTSVSLGKRKKSDDDSKNNNSSGAAAATATTPSGVGHEDDGLNVEDSGDEGSLSRGEAQRKKKARTTFTGRQIFELEKQFELKKYLSSSERADMAKLLNVTETQVGAPLLSFILELIVPGTPLLNEF